MATIIHILVSLIVAVLRAFAGALLALFSRAALGAAVLIALVLAALALTGTLSAIVRRRR